MAVKTVVCDEESILLISEVGVILNDQDWQDHFQATCSSYSYSSLMSMSFFLEYSLCFPSIFLSDV